jgi:LSD1 subclass zinc finger protein
MADYSARFNCPGCGSALETLEGAISMRCSFCGLIMRIGSPGRILKYFYEPRLEGFSVKFSIEKHLKSKGLTLNYFEIGRRLYYLPFYRFRGMSYVLYCERSVEIEGDDLENSIPIVKQNLQRKCGHFDLTVPAYENESFGLDSLGIRPEVIPLTALIDDNLPEDSVKIDIQISPEQAEQTAMAMFFANIGLASTDKEVLSSEMIGEGIAVIFYPVWGSLEQRFHDDVYDGLNKRFRATWRIEDRA